MNFWFNGVSAEDLGVVVENVPDEVFPQRRGETVPVAGRHGRVEVPDDTYDTCTITYNVHFKEPEKGQLRRRAREIAQWLLGSRGFCRLEDEYEPDHFRLARYAGPLNVDVLLKRWGKCTLEFECQPQRYLTSGEDEIAVSSLISSVPEKIFNPTRYDAAPLIRAELESNMDPYEVTLTRNYLTTRGETAEYNYLNTDGKIYGGVSAESHRTYTTEMVPIYGYDKAYARCTGYVIIDHDAIAIAHGGKIGLPLSSEEEFEINLPEGAADIILQASEFNSAPVLKLQVTPIHTVNIARISFGDTIVRIDFGDRRVIYLDSELQDACWHDGSNANSAVSVSSADRFNEFPKLKSGLTEISEYSGDESHVKNNLRVYVTPRWWEL